MSGRLRTRLGLGLAAIWVVVAGSISVARADAARLLLLSPDPNLLHATEVALEPWGLEVQVLREAAPAPNLPASAARARQLATAHGASSLAWISESPDGRALWLYELEDDRIVAQPVSQPPPFDAAEAAALALSLKALLRHSASAPPAERYGATPAAAEGGAEPAPVAPRPPGGFELAVAGGVRAFELTRGSAEPRLWLSLAWTTALLGGSVGPVLSADLGVRGVNRDRRGASSTLRSQGIGLGAMGRWQLGPHIDMAATGLVSLRLTHLTGSLDDDSPLDLHRANPCVTGWLETGTRVGRTRLFLRVGLEVPLRTQRYLVDGRTLLELAPATGEAALGVAVQMR